MIQCSFAAIKDSLIISIVVEKPERYKDEMVQCKQSRKSSHIQWCATLIKLYKVGRYNQVSYNLRCTNTQKRWKTTSTDLQQKRNLQHILLRVSKIKFQSTKRVFFYNGVVDYNKPSSELRSELNYDSFCLKLDLFLSS